MTGFVRASRLYDVEERAPVQWDWSKMRPTTESRAAVERAMEGRP